jgi:cell division protein FtsB
MADRRNQGLNQREKRALRRIILAVVVLSFLFLVFAPGRGLLSHRTMKKEIQALVRDNRTLQHRNIELAEEIERLKNDEAYLEQLAREKYGMLKKNEEVYELRTPRTKKKK